MRTQAFPPPFQGQRDDIPLASLQSPYAQYVTNFNLDTGVPTLRHGDSIWSQTAAKASEAFYYSTTYKSGAAQEMYSVVSDATPNTYYYNTSSTGAPTLAYTLAGTTSTLGTSLAFNKYLFFFNSINNTVVYYTGAAWASGAYTFSGSFLPFGGAAFKNRLYMISYGNAKYCYSNIDAITGATFDVDLSSLLTQEAKLYGIKAVSLSQGIQQETVLAFVFDSGEILVYSGSYPNSSNWAIVGRFIVSPPVDYHPFIDAKGDTFIITQTGLISLRTLFSNGADLATTQAISAPIKNRWVAPVVINGAIAVNSVRGVYDGYNDRLIIVLKYWVPVTTGAIASGYMMRFIYSFKTESWAEAYAGLGTGISSFAGGVAFYKNNIYYTTQGYRGIQKLEGATNYVDASCNNSETTGITYNIRTAPLYDETFGVNVTVGLELLSTTDLFAETGYKLISNLGQITTTNQLLPNQGSGVQNPYINIGVDANYVQVDISGVSTSSSTLGFQLNAMNLWSEKGGVR